MKEKVKIGILRETKSPPDTRVAVTPRNALEIISRFPNVEIYIQPSSTRCYSDDEYRRDGIPLKEDLSDCDILLGIKEIDPSTLISGKTYLFFAHVAKKQVSNREMFQVIGEKNIRLVDYEYLMDNKGRRLVAFGKWAGLIGTYNAIRAYGLKKIAFQLKPAYKCRDKNEMLRELKKANLEPIKIVLTGRGRVASGALEALRALNIREVKSKEFLCQNFYAPVFCRLEPWEYVERVDGEAFELNHFYNYPKEYKSIFLPYAKVANMYITSHYWDPNSPIFFTRKEIKLNDWNISILADISCDVNGPIPSTVRASSIENPFYDYDRFEEKEVAPFSKPENITVMAVDSLPGELPRDSSFDFGRMLIRKVFGELLNGDVNCIVKRATVIEAGKLKKKFAYLQDYLEGKE